MKTLTTEELQERLDSGPLALFDVRGDIEYEQGHIPGALTAPLGSLVFRVASVMNPDSTVIVYSGGGDCTLASEAVERLENLGLLDVHCYEGGLEGWRAARLPVVPSVHPKEVAWGPVIECRPLIVDRERAYGGVFSHKPEDVSGAGG
jgi:rhodanese-related sulfurtransferase